MKTPGQFQIEFYCKIRWLITFISEEIERIPVSAQTKERTLDICDEISTKVLSNIGKLDNEKLMSEMKVQLARFDLLIRDIEDQDSEIEAYMLLITHVADMLALMSKEI